DRSEATTDSDDSGAIIWPIISGASFLSWMLLEKNNKTGNIICWCFECEYSGDPKPKHNIDHIQARQTSSKKHSAYEHNHSLIPHCEEFVSSLRRLSQDILDEIKFMTQKCEYNARQQRR
ncbi:29112_t:CDS:2, partial [Racocetra persica]